MAEKRFIERYAGLEKRSLIGIEDTETGRVCVTIEENIKLLNSLNDENQSLTKEKQYFLKVIFAMGNYAEKGDYERIIDARDKVKQRVLE